jgi:hypothetical protein
MLRNMIDRVWAPLLLTQPPPILVLTLFIVVMQWTAYLRVTAFRGCGVPYKMP